MGRCCVGDCIRTPPVRAARRTSWTPAGTLRWTFTNPGVTGIISAPAIAGATVVFSDTSGHVYVHSRMLTVYFCSLCAWGHEGGGAACAGVAAAAACRCIAATACACGPRHALAVRLRRSRVTPRRSRSYGVSAITGARSWGGVKVSDKFCSGPAMTNEGDFVAVACADGNVVALDPGSGSVLWTSANVVCGGVGVRRLGARPH